MKTTYECLIFDIGGDVTWDIETVVFDDDYIAAVETLAFEGDATCELIGEAVMEELL